MLEIVLDLLPIDPVKSLW